MKETVLFAIAEQGDEILVFGPAIFEHQTQGNEVVVACFGGGMDKPGANILKEAAAQKRGQRTNATPAQAGKARDREFFESCQKLGIKACNIAFPPKRLHADDAPGDVASLFSELAGFYRPARIATYDPSHARTVEQVLVASAAIAEASSMPDKELDLYAQWEKDAASPNSDASCEIVRVPRQDGERAMAALECYAKADPQRHLMGLTGKLNPGSISNFEKEMAVAMLQSNALNRSELLDSCAAALFGKGRKLVEQLEAQAREMEASTTWRTGKLLTSIPRALKDGLHPAAKG